MTPEQARALLPRLRQARRYITAVTELLEPLERDAARALAKKPSARRKPTTRKRR